MSLQFRELNEKIKKQFSKMQETGKLFRVEVTGQQVWDAYLAGFKPGQDNVFRDPDSSEHNCNNDQNFVRRYGNIVAISDTYELVTMFDIDVEDTVYSDTIPTLSKLIKNSTIVDVFFESFKELNVLPYEKTKKGQELYQLGMKETFKQYTQEEADKFGVVRCDKTYNFDHFHVFVKKAFVIMDDISIESTMGKYRDNRNVFARGMSEIPLDTLELVRDLITQGSILNGEAHLSKVKDFVTFKKEYDTLPSTQKENWSWVKSYNLAIAKFRNEVIGTLCIDLAEGKELNAACLSWNKKVDPVNFMKAKAPITQKQIDDAEKFVDENGYTDSFDRVLVTMDDINVSEILHANAGDGKLKTVSKFDTLKGTPSTMHKRAQFDGIEEVSVEKFMKDILPTCTSIELLLENRFEENFVTLTTAKNKDSKPIMKWDNNYSWTYKNNLAGKSYIKDNVKLAGGGVDGVFRGSLQWNDEDTKGDVDLDLHCMESKGCEIYFSNKRGKSGGVLDVDMIRPSKIGIENITWQNNVPDDTYTFSVRNFCGGSNKGFKMEIDFGGETYNYHFTQPLGYKQTVKVATITLKKGKFTIEHHLPETASSRKIWNLDTNQFHKVKLVCASPNMWGANEVGNKHWLFMLDKCVVDSEIRGFHNENLNSELLQHRKVIDVLGNSCMIQPTKGHLAGIGFNATVKDDVILKLSGSHKRTIKLKFNN